MEKEARDNDNIILRKMKRVKEKFRKKEKKEANNKQWIIKGKDMKENKKNTKSLIIYLIIFAFVVAVSINAIINQESKKQEIKMQISQYEDELEKLKSEKEELIEQKEKINTDKYIENVARNKLDMFLPNEKVYVHSRW